MGLFGSRKPGQPSWNEGGKAGFGDVLGLILGGIGDGLSSYNGGQAWAVPSMLSGRQASIDAAKQARAAAEAAQAERMAAREDKMWEWQNKPKEQTPTELQRNYEYLQGLDPEAAKSYMSRQTNDTLWRQGPDGQFYPFDPTPQLPTKPVGKLTPIGNPNIPSGNPLAPNLNAILEEARMRGRNYMGGR